MGRQLAGVALDALRLGAIARVGAIAVGCLALAHCSGPFAGANYSPRVVDDGEPVPKGGGRYSVGKPYNINGRNYVPTENPDYRTQRVLQKADPFAEEYFADIESKIFHLGPLLADDIPVAAGFTIFFLDGLHRPYAGQRVLRHIVSESSFG